LAELGRRFFKEKSVMTSMQDFAKTPSRIALLATFLSAILLVPAAKADPITWTLNNVTFNDGGTAVGSFTWDADIPGPTGTFDIMTTAGSDTSGYSYIGDGGEGYGPVQVEFDIYTSDSDTELYLGFDEPLTDAGGTVGLDFVAESLTVGDNQVFFRDGPLGDAYLSAPSSQSSATPEPGTLCLVVAGIVGLWRRRLMASFALVGKSGVNSSKGEMS
jgi:hypothetical protein